MSGSAPNGVYSGLELILHPSCMEICSVVFCVILVINNQTDMDENIIYISLQCSVTGYVHSVLLFHAIIIIIFFLYFIDVFHFLQKYKNCLLFIM